MRRRNCRCEHGRALLSQVGHGALALACCCAAWLVLVSDSMGREPAHSPPGRLLSGKSLSRLLFPSTTKNEELPQEPTEPWEVATNIPDPFSQAATQTPTTMLQQRGYVAPEAPLTIVPVPSAAIGPRSAELAAITASPSRASTADLSTTRNHRAPASGIRSLWQTILGTDGSPPRSATVAATRQPPPTQRQRPDTKSAAPATANATRIASELLGQITGIQAVSRPAESQPVATSTSTNRFASYEAVATPPVKSQEDQSSRRLPEIQFASGEEPSDKEELIAPTRAARPLSSVARVDKPTPAMSDSSSSKTAQALPYAVTSAPAFALPFGTIPPPTALGQIPQSLSGSTHKGGALAELWQPITMDSNAPALPKPSERMAASAEAARIKQSASNDDGSNFASLMLQPFRTANRKPGTTSGRATHANVVANETSATSTIAESIQNSSLFRQLSMNMNGEAYSQPESAGELDGGSKLLRGEQIEAIGSSAPPRKILQTAATEDLNTRGDRQLVALMQKLAPEPADLSTDTGDLEPEPAPAPGAAGTGNKNEDTLEGAEKLGDAPVDRSLEFLRTETVLLKPGESQCDVGIAYIFTDNDFPILLTDGSGEIVAVTDVRFLVRELTVPLEYRVGLHKRVQGFLHLPVGWENTQIDVANDEDFNNDGGIGDLTFGLTIQCVEATANCPYVITTVSGTAPTGGDPFTGVVGISPTAPSLGDGFWSVQGSLLFIQQYDPVVLFYGLGFEESIEHEYVGIDFRPGTQFNYLLGVGFAVNERITLSTRFFGSYIEELRANGVRILGTNTEPMTIRMSATIAKPCDRLVEPFVEFGLNDDSVNSNVGITWTF